MANKSDNATTNTSTTDTSTDKFGTSNTNPGTDTGTGVERKVDNYSDLLTAKDAMGVERVVTVADNSWEPAPIEASDELKAAADERVAREEADREERLARLGIGADGIDESKLGQDANTGSTGDPTTTNDAAAVNQTPGESTVNQDKVDTTTTNQDKAAK